MNILTLEDEFEINDFYEILLKEFDYQVFSTSTSQEAIETVKKEKIDIAIVDYRLSLTNSEKNGLEAIQVLKELQPDMKIIMVSANYSHDLEADFKKKGIDLLVRKPFHIDDMLFNIKHLTNTAG